MRILHETGNFEKSSFVTLTYDDDHMPEDKGLHKRDFQLFMKRLRKDHVGRISYYACGEYGDKFGRPHYHAIMLGVASEEGGVIKDAWRKGFVKMGGVSKNSIQYVAGYVMKKYSGVKAKEVYGDREPPFQLCSLGFGKRWLLENKELVVRNLGITVQGVPMGMPRYYRKILGEEITQDMLNQARLERLADHQERLFEKGIGPLDEWREARDVRKQRAEEIRSLEERRKREAF